VRQDRGKLYAYLAFVGAFAALNYASRLVPNKPDRNVLYTWSAAIGGLVQLGIVLGIVLAIARGRPKDEYLGLRRPSSWGLAAGLIVLVLIGVFALSAVLSPLLHPGEEQGLVPNTWHPDRAAPFVANFLVVAVLAPIVEEITFRGLGYKLIEPFGKWTAILVVGLLFGLAHGLVEALPILAAFGAGLAYVRMRTGSVYPGMIVHSAFNSLVLIVAVTS
jgi:membrane protease YdiL (CAAX protease family)